MTKSKFYYVVFIRTTRERVWNALTKPEFTKSFWFGIALEARWEKGASWKMVFPDGRTGDAGEVLEAEEPVRLVMTWRNELRPELKAEGYSRCTFELETVADTVKLTVSHEIDVENSKLIEAVSGGWPKVLSSLKSLLETGRALPEIHTAYASVQAAAKG